MELGFPELARFLHTHVASNPLFSAYLDEDMKKQIADLQSMLEVPEDKGERLEVRGERLEVKGERETPTVEEDTIV